MTWRFMQIEPQPARGKLVESMWDDPEWIAEEKYDGDRRIAQFCEKVVRFTGRRVSAKDGLFVEKTENVPHLSNLITPASKYIKLDIQPPSAALDGTVLDGEMIAVRPAECTPGKLAPDEGGQSKFVTSIMGSLPEEAVRKQIERGWLRYVVFDCLFYRGKDIRHMQLLDRNEYMCEALEAWKNPFAIVAPNEINTNKRRGYENIIARGGEGVILKSRQHRYGDKQGWVKVKKTATADVVIMGFVPAKEMSKKKGEDKATLTKYAAAGLIGAIQCGQHLPRPVGAAGPRDEPLRVLTEVATVSGMDDALRAEVTKRPKKYVGKVIEIEHNGREPTGRFRHPRFNRFRPDKQARECVYREDET